MLAARLPAGAIHQFVPLDFPAAVRRFLDHWRPDLACFAESELWPNLLAEARAARHPDGSRQRAHVAALVSPLAPPAGPIRALLGGFDLVLAQSDG